MNCVLADLVDLQLHDIPCFGLKQSTGKFVHTHWLNGSICELNGLWFFCYRTEQKPLFHAPMIHICQINKNFLAISDNFTLKIPTNMLSWFLTLKNDNKTMFRAEDPRLVVHDNDLYVFFTDGVKMGYTKINLQIIDDKLIDANVDNVYWLKPPNVRLDGNYDGREKNWSPLSYKGYLHFLYCSNPVVFCKIDKDKVSITNQVHRPIDIITLSGWRYGFVKGGTPLYGWSDDRLIHFFHSTKMYNDRRVYMVGAMTFDIHNLKPLQISRYPLIIPSMLESTDHDKHNFVLFPSGAIRHNNGFYLSLGWNDKINKVIHLTDDMIEFNLTYPFKS